MQPVNVKGYGVVPFPDDISVDEIRATLRRRYTDLSDNDLLQGASEYGAPTGNVAAPYNPSLMERAAQGIGGALYDSGIISNRAGAQQIGKNVTSIGEMLPGVGDVAAVDDFVRAKAKGDSLGMGLAALGVIPLAGDLAGKAGKAVKGAFQDSDNLGVDINHIVTPTNIESQNLASQAPVDVASNINQQGILNEEFTSETSQRSIQESIRVRGGIGLLDEQNRANQAFSRAADGTLSGLPVDIPGFTPRHSEGISNTAKNYVEGFGENYYPPNLYAKVDPERAGEIANLYDIMPHNPSDPEVKEAYDAMIDEVELQYQAAIDNGLKVEFIDFDKMGDPYNGSPRQATEDILNNNHMYVFSTRDGFGSNDAFDPVDNPMLKETNFEISGQKALANDLFRAVHDYFGHAKEGVGFRAAGEENAWRNHSAMFSKKARRALTTETRGQNSWLNFGPYGETNRTAQIDDTIFADQKVGLLPEWVSESFDDVSATTPYKKDINK